MRNMVLAMGLAALAVGVEANEPAPQAAALVSNINGVSVCSPWGCGLNSPVVDSATVVAPPASVRQSRRHRTHQIPKKSVAIGKDKTGMPTPPSDAYIPTQKLAAAGLNGALLGPRFGETGWFPRCCEAATPMSVRIGNGGDWGCGGNSPIVDGAAIVAPTSQARPARRHHARQLPSKTVVVDDINTHTSHPPTAHARPSKRNTSALTSMREARFGEAMAPGCALYACDSNSPVVEGAAIVPARRHQAAQIGYADVVLDEAGTEARQNRIGDSRNMRSAVRDTRFGEAYTNAASSLKNGQQLTPSQIKVLVMPLQEQRFGEAWGKNLNSPVIDSATIL